MPRRVLLIKLQKIATSTPLIPEELQRIKKHTVQSRGGKEILRVYGNSISRALRTLYPTYRNLLTTSEVKKWQDTNAQRQFFQQVVRDMGVDTNSPGWWNCIKKEDVIEKGGGGILHYYNGSVHRALRSLFPLQVDNATSKIVLESHRKTLAEIGRGLGIDPDNLDEWHEISTRDVLKLEAGQKLLKVYHGSLAKALKALHPSFRTTARSYGFWKNIHNQKEFMDQLAKEVGFDPVSGMEQWNAVTPQLVIDRGGKKLLSHYSKKISPAA